MNNRQIQSQCGPSTKAVTSVLVWIVPTPWSFMVPIIFLCIAEALLLYSQAHSAVSGWKLNKTAYNFAPASRTRNIRSESDGGQRASESECRRMNCEKHNNNIWKDKGKCRRSTKKSNLSACDILLCESLTFFWDFHINLTKAGL